ncbi:MAG: hypothetical protein II924_01900, partial [Kiritimatiellae bacterium]|nr:hypothetical protein [Kiritimatiellia bacterium]
MKKLMVLTVAALTAAALTAAPTTTGKRSAGTRTSTGRTAVKAVVDEPTSERAAKVTIDMFPRLNKQATFGAPSVNGAAYVTGAYTRPRKWIVLETKYTTYADFQDRLTFTWHVLLETKTSTLNRSNKEEIPPYSYFTTVVTYQNIPDGSHAASVVLPPSYLERYGEPCAVGIVITNSKGEVLAGDCESSGGEVKDFAHPKTLDQAFWNNQKIMNATGKDGKPMIERR